MWTRDDRGGRHRGSTARERHSRSGGVGLRGSPTGGSLSKLRVTDMAVEFGIPVDEVQGLLRQMDVPVRSHLSPLTDDQVSRVRARWEREKRERAQKQAAPPAPARRRRGAASTAAVAAEAAPAIPSPDAG